MPGKSTKLRRSPTPGLTAKKIRPAQEPLQNELDKESSSDASIQFKLTIGSPNDPLEHEADAVGDAVMRMPEQNFIQHKCHHCEQEERLQRRPYDSFFQKKESSPATKAPNIITDKINAGKGHGSSMDTNTQSFMQNRFGADFSGVKIHIGTEATQMNRALNAKAFTAGSDIYFNEEQYQPNSSPGKYLLAHELTHVIQQAGSSSVKINRFAEPEHKRVGNLATTKFPYFARVTTDEVALRSSPKGRRVGNEFHNLVASLRKNVRLLVVGNVSKWMRVIVDTGDALDGKTNSQINASGLAGYVSEELLIKESGVFDQQLPVLPGLTLTYGDFTAMGGDHFKSFSDIEDKALTADGIAKIKKFIDVVDGRRKGEFEDPSTIDKEWSERYKNLAFENISHFSHGGTALETWKKIHYQALKSAANGAYMGNIGMMQRAYAVNGFGDHFLTDSFSGGHIRVPRIKIIRFYEDFFGKHLDSILNYIYSAIGDKIVVQIFEDHPNVTGMGLVTGHSFCADNKKAIKEFKTQVEKEMSANNLQPQDLKKLLVHYVGGAVSKVLHDEDGAGLQVKSKKHPDGWKAFGDGKLDSAGQKYIVEAVEFSKNELIQAINIGLDFKKETGDPKLYEKVKPWVYPVSKIEEYVPETDIAKSTPLPEWRIDLGWDMMDQPTQVKLAALVKRYLDDKTLETMIAKIPLSVEQEVDWSPNVYARPRDATRKVLLEFRDNPAEFLAFAAAGPGDFQKVLDNAAFCTVNL